MLTGTTNNETSIDRIIKAENEIIKEAINEANARRNKTSAMELKKINKRYTEGQILTEKMKTVICEPLKNNRFIVSFPSDLNISEWTIKEITMPIIENRNCSNTVVVFKKFINESLSKKIIKLMPRKKFNITVKFLDATGVQIVVWSFEILKILSVDFGGKLSYDNDNISEITVVFKTKDLILKK